jgi:Reverse transcriptase (RNA-dependent DNA polymerase)
MDKIKGAKFFTKFDVRWGYNNIRIKAEDQWKAAFKTNCGLFEPTVMFFGMCNSPATFQAMMDSIFSDMIEEWRVIVYMDDILNFEKTRKNSKNKQNRYFNNYGNMTFS